MERLDKFLCDCGAGTRSQVKAILKAGRVQVDAVPERDGSRKIDPQSQTVTMDGEMLNRRGCVVLMLNKPAGFVTATEDKNDRTVMELLPASYVEETSIETEFNLLLDFRLHVVVVSSTQVRSC